MSEYEPNTIEGLAGRYEALGLQTVTDSFTTGPDETHAIGELWTTELERTFRAFRFTSWTLQHCLDIRTSMILQHDSWGNPVRDDGSPGPKVSDNRLTQLIFDKDAQALLSMIEMRDTFNYQVIQIARYPLREGTISSLGRLVEFDNEYRLEHPQAD